MPTCTADPRPPLHPAPTAARRAVLLVGCLLLGAGCSSVYYAAMSQLGWAKADLLANRLQMARDAMDATRIELADALPDFADARTDPDEDRAKQYRGLTASYSAAQENAALVTERRVAVERAGTALFDEWQHDVASASDASARARQQYEYGKMRAGYDRLLDAMRGAEASLVPVLRSMQAEVAAVDPASATSPTPGIDPADGDRAIRNLQLAVALADQYIAELESLP